LNIRLPPRLPWDSFWFLTCL